MASDVTDGAVVEIGRFKGGSTFLLAAALRSRAALWSYDIHVVHDAAFTGAELDAELSAALARYDLDGSVHLVVGDSRVAEPPNASVRLLFIDGDHSYEGVVPTGIIGGLASSPMGTSCSTMPWITGASAPPSTV